MGLALAGVIIGLVLLVWSADLFVEGSVVTANHFKMPPLLIGMVIVGFGTSAPEMIVSAFASAQGNPGIALGNAYGSNICNIGLILGLTALISPVVVQSKILRKELPILTICTGLAVFQLLDGYLSRMDAAVLLSFFLCLMIWTVVKGRSDTSDNLACEIKQQLQAPVISIKKAFISLFFGLFILIAASRLLVWGAVEIAKGFGVSDLIIGLTIVAVGTSLPELAASVIATRKGENDIAIGNVLGSNLFNTLAVTGIAGIIHPITVSLEILKRDLLVMSLFTVSLFILGYGFRGRQGSINRYEGALLLLAYLAYNGLIVYTVAFRGIQ